MPETRSPASRTGLLFATIVVATIALHGRAIAFGFSYLDDDALIVDQQQALAPPAGLWRAFARPYFPPSGRDHAYYRPLASASYSVDAALFGARAGGYHVTNVLIAACAAALLFLLLLRFGYGAGVALFGGLLYAVHPALAETVAWIPGRPDGLLVLFALAAWLLFGRARDTGGWASRAGHLLAWLAALLCKEAALVLPLAYAGHLVLVERRPLRSVAEPWLLAGWAAVLAIYLAARAVVLSPDLGAGAVTAATGGSIPSLVLGRLVLPVHLSVLATPEDSPIWPGAVAASALAAIAFAPGVRRARVLFAAGCFVAFVLPGLPASRLLALESRLALPAIAVVLIACELAHRLGGPPHARLAGGAALIAALAAGTIAYAGNFRDRLSFAQAAVRGSPHAALGHRNLGLTYQLAGQTALARDEYQAAIAANAGEPIVHNNLAVLLMAEGRLPEAAAELRAEIAVNPDYTVAHDNLARVLRALGRADEAATEDAIVARQRANGP